MADISQVKLPNGDTYNLVDETSGYIKSYTETDPVFSASAAAGITATDISNWNGKVSDDKTWNGVTLNKQTSSPTWNIYLPFVGGTNNENAYYATASTTPTANYISKYDANSYLYSTTPSANDNSTKVATTAYVDGAIPDTSGFVSKSGDTMSGNLSFTDGQSIIFIAGEDTILDTPERTVRFQKSGQSGSGSTAYTNFTFAVTPSSQQQTIQIRGIHTPTSNSSSNNTYIASKEYVDNSIPKVYSSTNTGGYLTMATLPIYDGTVV